MQWMKSRDATRLEISRPHRPIPGGDCTRGCSKYNKASAWRQSGAASASYAKGRLWALSFVVSSVGSLSAIPVSPVSRGSEEQANGGQEQVTRRPTPHLPCGAIGGAFAPINSSSVYPVAGEIQPPLVKRARRNLLQNDRAGALSKWRQTPSDCLRCRKSSMPMITTRC